jgi:hypothetical protein
MGHVDVGDEQIRPVFADRFEARRPIVRHDHVVAESPDDLGDDPLVIEVVLGYDN